MNWSKLKKAELVEMCIARGISTDSALKADLIAALKQAINEEGDANGDHEEEAIGGHEEEEESSNESDSEGEQNESAASEEETGKSWKTKLALVREERRKTQAEQETLKLKIELAKLRSNHSGAVERYTTSTDEKWSAKGLPSQGENEDFLIFIKTFEKISKLNKIPENKWNGLLPALLNVNLRNQYARLPYEVCLSYESVKEALMSACRLSSRTYLEKFRTIHRSGKETYIQFLDRLRDAFCYYLDVSKITDLQGLTNACVQEQLRQTLPAEVRQFVDARVPTSAVDMATWADLCFDCGKEARAIAPHSTSASKGQNKYSARQPAKSDHGVVVSKPAAPADKPEVLASPTAGVPKPRGKDYSEIICHQCGMKGHYKSWHKQNPNPALQTLPTQTRLRSEAIRKYEIKNFVIPCLINGESVEALRDSACHMTLVHEKYVRPRQISAKTPIPVQSVFGEIKPISTADVVFQSPRFGDSKSYILEVGVVPNLHVAVLLGHDLFVKYEHLTDPIIASGSAQCEPVGGTNRDSVQGADGLEQMPWQADISTRAVDYDAPLGTSGKALNKRSDSNINYTNHANVIKSGRAVQNRQESNLITAKRDDLKLNEPHSSAIVGKLNPSENDIGSKGSEGDERGEQVGGSDSSEMVTEKGLVMNHALFKQAQETDQTLLDIWQKAKAGHPKYYIFGGLLYCKGDNIGWDDDEEEGCGSALVAPECCRLKIIELAHSALMGSHMGINKTKNRILKRFYWPELGKQVTHFVKSCPECQLTSFRRKKDRAQLVRVPVISKVFDEWTWDIIGELPRSKTGKKYALVLVDHASHWPEVIPLTSMRADKICEKLIHLFSRVGIPSRLYSDRGSSLISEVVAGLQKMLGCEPIHHASYHHESSGICEKFTQKLKQMLRAFITDNPQKWEELLPYLLFSYREIEHSTTKISPFMCVYGRNPRGPLDVLKEAWSKENPALPYKRNVVEYLLDTRAKLEHCAKIAKENSEQSKDKAKAWYDKVSSSRTLSPGDKVLVLLPSSTDKLKCKWVGPGEVLRKVNEVTYEISIGRRVSVLHINLLKLWIDRETKPDAFHANVTLVADPCQDEFEAIPGVDDDTENGEPEIDDRLSIHQRGQISQLTAEYADIFRDEPGRTHLIEHEIKLTDDKPCVARSYRIPDSLRAQVAIEIEKMLQQGIIQPSHSPHKSPLLCIRKNDNSIRVLADMRLVNNKTVADQYPAPDPRLILDRCASAKYISCVDLNKAFYQIPLSKASRPVTAFEANGKLFEYCTTPMGGKTSSKTFQRLADIVLKGAEDHAAAHIDDFVIFSDTFEEHLAHLKDLFECLRNAGLTAKLAKCQFAKRSIKCLGHIIENGVIKPDPQKVKAITEYPIPKTKRQVRSFVGICNFYRNHICNFSAKAFALTELTKKNNPDKVKWGDAEEKAFCQLKADLCAYPCLVPPDPSKPYVIHVDASKMAVASCLMQCDETGAERAVAYASRKLLPREQKYAVVELEALGIVWSLTHFEPYVFGNHVTVKTDHHSLQWLKNFANSNPRLLRWSLVISRFNVDIAYHRGAQNVIADGLSRAI